METKYFVNPEKRTVTCVLVVEGDCCEPDLVFKATATCKPEDVFSAEIGMSIANHQAHILFHRYHKAMEKKRKQHLERKIEEVDARIAKRTETIAVLKAKVKEAVSKVESVK